MAKSVRKKRQQHKKSSAMAKWREKAGGEDYGTIFQIPEGMKRFDLKATGTYSIDIIPYISKSGNEYVDAGEQWFERTFYIHRNVGVNNDWVVCPARTFKKPCPICEFTAKLRNDPEGDEKTVDALKPSKRIITNAIDMKKNPDEVQLWHISHWFFGKALKQALDAAYEDHEENMDEFFQTHYLRCTVEEAEGGFSGYNVVRVDFKRRKEDLDEEILEQAADLDEILVVKSYDELKEMLYAAPDDDEDDEPKGKRKTTKKSRKAEPDEDEDEDEEEVAPKKSRSKKSKSEPEEEDDDDDDDDIDVDDEDWEEDDDSEDDDSEDDDSEDDDSEDDEDWEEEEEPEEKPVKKRTKKTKSRR